MLKYVKIYEIGSIFGMTGDTDTIFHMKWNDELVVWTSDQWTTKSAK